MSDAEANRSGNCRDIKQKLTFKESQLNHRPSIRSLILNIGDDRSMMAAVVVCCVVPQRSIWLMASVTLYRFKATRIIVHPGLHKSYSAALDQILNEDYYYSISREQLAVATSSDFFIMHVIKI